MQPAQLGELTDPGRIEAFLARYPGQVCKDYDSTRLKCGIITLDELQLAGTLSLLFVAQLLRDGELVAFPTETVYGLGANALNADAVTNIFRTKRRPLTDPVIVHLHNPAIITKYVSDCTHLDLGLQFWPGPFTLVLKYRLLKILRANLETLQTTQLLSASTGFVGFRVPHNDVALKLLELSGVPVGAPSANIFSHVSPTSPIHVFNDFYDQRVFIIDGPQCQNGIESTVAKVVDVSTHLYARTKFGCYDAVVLASTASSPT
jgi:tRNA threonylcarbamoyl adenosine modification protein (Sua5/YciO/YrdC/YwlC family)